MRVLFQKYTPRSEYILHYVYFKSILLQIYLDSNCALITMSYLPPKCMTFPTTPPIDCSDLLPYACTDMRLDRMQR